MKLFSRIFSMLVTAFAFSVLFCAPTFAEESLSITVDGTPTVEATPNELGTASADVYVTSTARDGYKLSISDSDNENALVSGQGNAINALSESVAADNFTTNAWGVKVGDIFLPVPKLSDNVLELANTTKAATNEKHTVTFGMKVDGTAVSGDYSSEVVFTAVANPLVVRKTTLKPGWAVNEAWKTLANNSSTIYTAADNKITNIQKFTGDFTDALQSVAQDIATADSDWPVYTWFNNGTIYYYTEADEIFFNENSAHMFYNMTKLVSIEFNFGLETDIDPDRDGVIANVQNPVYITSEITYMSSMFKDTSSLASLDVSNWDTSKVTNMMDVFKNTSSLAALNVSNWDTSKVTNMSSMFYGTGLATIDVSGWDTSSVTNMQYMFHNAASLTTLDVSKWDVSNVTKMDLMFSSTPSLTTLDVSKWDVSNVVSTSSMFNGASSLTSLDVSKWNTGNVTNMSSMFANMASLTTLDVSKWDTSKVTNMSSMFANMASLTTLDVSKWDTSKVTNMGYMFSRDKVLASIDVSNWDTSSVTNTARMFYWNSALASLNVSNWDTSKVTDMHEMFALMYSITTLDVSKWDTSKVTDMSRMFNGAGSLTALDVSKWDVSSVTDMSSMFFNNSALTSLDVSKWDTSKVTSMVSMFCGASALAVLDLSGWNTSNVSDMGSMFFADESLVTIYASTLFDTSSVTDSYHMFSGANRLVGGNGTTYSYDHIDKEYARIDTPGTPGYFTEKASTADLETGKVVNAAWKTLANGAATPYTEYASNITSIKQYSGEFTEQLRNSAQNIATSASNYPVYTWYDNGTIYYYSDANTIFLNTDSSSMFCNLGSLADLDNNFDTSKVTDMNDMLSYTGLTTLDLSGWDMSNVTDISGMFYGSSSLVNLNVSNWNTSSVVDMSSTFVKTGSLTTVDVANWNTSNVENMSGMFSGSGLTTLDVSRWEVNNVKNMANMFNGIHATVLDLSNWDTSNVENMNSMFEYSALVTIYASNKFDTSAVTDSDYMFSGTSNLVGGNGTTWDYTHTNKEYARIDTATTPGYFTLKTN